MKLDLSTVLPRILPMLVIAKRYSVFIFIIVFLGIYVYLVQRIGQLIQNEPSQSAIETKVKPVNRLKIDQEAVKQITDLEAQNIEIQSLFDEARQNPFTE